MYPHTWVLTTVARLSYVPAFPCVHAIGASIHTWLLTTVAYRAYVSAFPCVLHCMPPKNGSLRKQLPNPRLQDDASPEMQSVAPPVFSSALLTWPLVFITTGALHLQACKQRSAQTHTQVSPSLVETDMQFPCLTPCCMLLCLTACMPVLLHALYWARDPCRTGPLYVCL